MKTILITTTVDDSGSILLGSIMTDTQAILISIDLIAGKPSAIKESVVKAHTLD